jgi:hypothetical protein
MVGVSSGVGASEHKGCPSTLCSVFIGDDSMLNI